MRSRISGAVYDPLGDEHGEITGVPARHHGRRYDSYREVGERESRRIVVQDVRSGSIRLYPPPTQGRLHMRRIKTIPSRRWVPGLESITILKDDGMIAIGERDYRLMCDAIRAAEAYQANKRTRLDWSPYAWFLECLRQLNAPRKVKP